LKVAGGRSLRTVGERFMQLTQKCDYVAGDIM
jgi:hypothetical protein